MAFAHVGDLGTGLSTAANQATLAITTTAQALAGSLVVVLVADDNNQTTTGDGATGGAVSGVVDSAGNTYERGKEYVNCPSGTTAQDGADVSIWWKVLGATLASGGTITATFRDQNASDATAMTAKNFSVGAGSQVAVEGTPGGATGQASMDVTTANIACLRVRAVALENNVTTALTPTSTWAIFVQAVSGAGTAATEIGIRGEWLISTGTGGASAPTFGGSGDKASCYVAFKELPLQSLTATLVTDADTFGTHVITATAPLQTLTAVLLTNTETFGTDSVSVGAVALAATTLSNTNTFGTQIIGMGPVALTATLLGEVETFGTQTISVGAVVLTATTLLDADTFHTHTILQAGPQTLTAEMVVEANFFGIPKVTLSGVRYKYRHQPFGYFMRPDQRLGTPQKLRQNFRKRSA